MPSPNLDQARESVRQVHEQIQHIFATPGPAGHATIAALMPVFADDFSMVTTAGRLVTRAQVEQLFSGGQGARPGLEIRVSELQGVWQTGDSVAVRYKEVHRLAGVQTARLALAILTVTSAGVRWQALHETAIAANP